MTNTTCVFCRIVMRLEPATYVYEWPETIAIVPLDPCAPQHTLVIPRQHVPDFAANPAVTGRTMQRASELIAELGWRDRSVNLITSKGRAATQSVFHLHVHVLPRAENDGLALPWYSGRRKRLGASV